MQIALILMLVARLTGGRRQRDKVSRQTAILNKCRPSVETPDLSTQLVCKIPTLGVPPTAFQVN